jgi:hypothetical protein
MAKQRYQTYFGVSIPPFKEEKLGAGSITIRFILTGRTPSKKNNQMSVAVRKFARAWATKQEKTGRPPSWKDVHKAISMCKSKVRPNKEYQEWVEKMKPILHEQSSKWMERLSDKGLIFPLQKSTLSLRLYFKNRYVTDTVNKQQSIQDLLVAAGIISNDDYKSLNPIHSASASFYEEIIHDIAFISLSFRL